MSAPLSGTIFMTSRPMSWIASVVVFSAAAALQVVIFGLVVPSRLLVNVPSPLAVVIATAWLVLPPIIATLLAVRTFQLVAREPAQRSTSALIAILVLPLLSLYLGVTISFNVWGGK
jgi:hypothetical protein